jgi:hypothetical protein
MFRFLLALLLLALVTPIAGAAVPDASLSQADPVLVGNSTGMNRGNAYHVSVRDASNAPKVGAVVSIGFLGSGAHPTAQQDPGINVDCPTLVMSRLTDAAGDAVFLARIAGFDDLPSAEVRADGVLIRRITVRSTDLNGDGATNLPDFDLFRRRYLSDPSAPATDFNQDGTTNLADFAIFRAEYLSGVQNTVCP